MNSIVQDEDTGVVYISLADRAVRKTVPHNENINVDYATDGEVVGIEILRAGREVTL